MKKVFCLLFILLLISFSQIAFADCNHDILSAEPDIPFDHGSYHSHTVYVYDRCPDCNEIIGVTATSYPLNHQHNIVYKYSRFSPLNASKHTRVDIHKGLCTCNCGNPCYEEYTSTELHSSGSGYTSESCNGITHYFYKVCSNCGSTFLAGTAPCDGINHPNNAINKVPHTEHSI